MSPCRACAVGNHTACVRTTLGGVWGAFLWPDLATPRDRECSCVPCALHINDYVLRHLEPSNAH